MVGHQRSDHSRRVTRSPIGMEVLVGVDLMTDVALEPLTVGFPIEGALTPEGDP